MKFLSVNPIIRDKFDFEVGYLIKSPCKECDQHELFPGCEDDCSVLNKIHTKLASGISCRYSMAE